MYVFETRNASEVINQSLFSQVMSTWHLRNTDIDVIFNANLSLNLITTILTFFLNPDYKSIIFFGLILERMNPFGKD